MWCLEALLKINVPGWGLPQPYPLRYHPEILKLRRFVAGLPVRADYKLQLRRTIYRYADHFLSGVFLCPEIGGTTKTNCSSWHWVIGTKSTWRAFFRIANMHHRDTLMNIEEFLAYTRLQDQIDQNLLEIGAIECRWKPDTESPETAQSELNKSTTAMNKADSSPE